MQHHRTKCFNEANMFHLTMLDDVCHRLVSFEQNLSVQTLPPAMQKSFEAYNGNVNENVLIKNSIFTAKTCTKRAQIRYVTLLKFYIAVDRRDTLKKILTLT